jgi:3',5'-cyclic AMP phosphodiesterase CpdA
MRIAHLSDLHLLDLKHVGARQFLGRRLVGGVNLLTRRRGAHSAEVFERLLEDVIEQSPDHSVITGDLSNLALESEFERVAAYLRLLWDYERLSVIPGNHDYYTPEAVRERRFEKTFYPYMFPEFSDLDAEFYPYGKRLDTVSIFGLCSAVLPPVGFAWGEVKQPQMMRFVQLVHQPRFRNTFKIVLVHHHFHERRGLGEFTATMQRREELADLLLDNGVDLVLHGHDHIGRFGWLTGGGRRIPVIGAGSATATSARPDLVARYNLYTIDEGALVRREVRCYDDRTRRFVARSS